MRVLKTLPAGPTLTVLIGVESVALTWLSFSGMIPFPALLAGYGIAFASYLAARPFLTNLNAPAGIWFLVALVLRVPWLSAGLPLSDDAWRYLHDGRAQLAGVNPYRYPPAAPEAAVYAGPERGLINHPELPTIYPPGAQFAFRLAAMLGGTLLVWKGVVLGADLLLGLIVGLVAARRGIRNGAALYLLHPLPVIEFAGNGHLDVLAILGLVGAIALIERGRRSSGIALAGSIAIKYLALPVAPFFVRDAPPGRRSVLLIGLVASLVLVYLPFLDYPPIGSLGVFARTFEFNGLAFTALSWLPGVPARLGLGLGMAAVLLVAWFRGARAESATFAWMAALLLASPIVHPWYVTWLVPFLVWRRAPWALAWTGTVVLAYAVLPAWRAEGVWHLPFWAFALEYAPVLALLAWWSVGRRPSGQRWNWWRVHGSSLS